MRLFGAVGAVSVVLAVLITGSGAAQVQPGAAAYPDGGTLFLQEAILDSAPVASTSGVKLDVQMNALSRPSYSSSDSAALGLSTPTGGESHTWDFEGDFMSTKSSGAATITSGTAFGSYGSADLTLTPTGTAKKIDVCNANNYTLEQSEKVTGTVSVDTGTYAWGDVSSKSLSFVRAVLDSTYKGSPTCTFTPPCPHKIQSDHHHHRPAHETAHEIVEVVSWNMGAHICCELAPDLRGDARAALGAVYDSGVSIDFSGSSGSAIAKPQWVVTREVTLSSPAGASRTDLVVADSPAWVLRKRGKSAKIAIRSSGSVIHGSGTLANTAAGKHVTEKCTGGSGSETDTSWASSYIPGSPGLSVSEQVEGPIALPSGATGTISRQTTS